MRIKYIVPFPFESEALALRGQQIRGDLLADTTEVVCAPTRGNGIGAGSHYDATLYDMYVTEAGLAAEDEGFDAVIMDTVSDSGMKTLRSRLTIPVIGPGLVSYAAAMILGKRFSIITYLPEYEFLNRKTVEEYHLEGRCASFRAAGFEPDFENLLGEDPVESFELFVEAGRLAIEEDGADILLLGSTTMHQAGDYMAERLPAPVVNPGPLAIKFTEMVVQLGLSHSKVLNPSPAVPQDDKWFSLASIDPVGS